MKIQLVRADVTSLKVDAMVTTSQAATGGSANLLARFIIHADVIAPDGERAEERLRDATTAALRKAEDLAVGSVGLPTLWSATPEIVERCARNMLRATV